MRKPFKIALEKTRRQFLLGSASLGSILGFTLNGYAAGSAVAAPAPDPHTHASLTALAQRMFPHQAFDATAFSGVADAIAAEASTSMPLAELVSNGIKALDPVQDSQWLQANEQVQLAAMEAIQEEPFFQYVLNKSIDVLYRDQSLLTLLGYEGSSIEKGGYLHRGFDDIDWLP